MNESNQSGSCGKTPTNRPAPDTDEKLETQPPASDRREVGGPPGLEPTRYGDWEKAGRCIDF